MPDMKMQDFLMGLKDLIAQYEGGEGEVPPEGETANEAEPAPEAAAETPEEEMPEEQAGEATRPGTSNVLSNYMSKPKMRM